MGSRSGKKSDRGYVYQGNVERVTYEEEVNGVKVIRTRWVFKKRKKKKLK